MTTLHHLILPDGRSLDYYVSGPADAIPVIWHHGTPSSGLPSAHLRDAVLARGLRLVTMSRAGYGASARHRGRRVVDVVDDTAALLRHLGSPPCLVGGHSGGGPHALACAARLPGVRAAASVAGVAPYDAHDLDFLAGMGEGNIVEFNLALEGEEALRPWIEREAVGLADATPEAVVAAMDSILPPIDKACITEDFGHQMVADLGEALRHGVEGWIDDDLAFCAPWGFSLDEITVPVAIWQGDQDLMVPFAHGQWLGRAVPNAQSELYEGEGHISIGIGKVEQILDSLIKAGGLGSSI